MSTVDIVAAGGEPAPSIDTCWCCGAVVGDTELARLGSHPEVGVCEDCARFLHRRAQALRDRKHLSLGGVIRAVTERVRQIVLRYEWQRLPLAGPLLRRLDRFLP